MRKMINKKHEIAKMLEEIIDYAEAFDIGICGLDTWY